MYHGNKIETGEDVVMETNYIRQNKAEPTHSPTTVKRKDKKSKSVQIKVEDMCLHAQIIRDFSGINKCQQNSLTDWTYNCKVECPKEFPWETKEHSNSKMNLHCSSQNLKTSSESQNVPKIPYRDKCLDEIIKTNCQDSMKVPNIIHYIWFGNRREFRFFNFLSLYSVHVHQKPCLIFIHGETLPYGIYWTRTLQVIKNIIHVYRDAPRTMYNHTFKFVEHKADVGRLQALKEYGGMYFDTDTVLLRTLNPLRHLEFTMSQTRDDTIGNGLIVSAKNARFIDVWLKEYVNFNPNKWGEHSVYLPFKLSKRHPDLIRVENRTFLHGGTLDQIFMSNFKWEHLYAIHLYIRYYSKCPYDGISIRTLNTTLGSTGRHVLFGSKELCYNL